MKKKLIPISLIISGIFLMYMAVEPLPKISIYLFIIGFLSLAYSLYLLNRANRKE